MFLLSKSRSSILTSARFITCLCSWAFSPRIWDLSRRRISESSVRIPFLKIFFAFTEYPNKCRNVMSPNASLTLGALEALHIPPPANACCLVGLASLGCKGSRFSRGIYPGFILNTLRKRDLQEMKAPPPSRDIRSSKVLVSSFALALSFG